MKVINYWEKFLSTGSINDYLNYRGKEATEYKEAAEGKDGKGAEQVEGTGQCYRDDFKSGTRRGV